MLHLFFLKSSLSSHEYLGKTVTIVETIKQILRLDITARILACAPSNSAADTLASRLVEHVKNSRQTRNEIRMLRLNSFQRAKDTVKSSLLEFCFFKKGTDIFDIPDRLLLTSYHIIVTTTLSSGYWLDSSQYSFLKEGFHFTHIILDEAAQAMEPETMIPFSFATPRTQIILAGDPHQLGPIIRSPAAIQKKLGISFLERLMSLTLYKNNSNNTATQRCVTKLINNYRSHQKILQVPSKLFYSNELVSRADPELFNSLCGWSELRNQNFPILFRGIEGEDRRDGESPSWYNCDEIPEVKRLILSLIQSGLAKKDDIGLIL